MAAKKTSVVFIKRVEDRDKKTGEKIVIPAGTKGEMTAQELKKYKDCVRVVKDDDDGKKRPVLASGAAPDTSGSAGDGDDEGGDEDGEGDGAGDGATGN